MTNHGERPIRVRMAPSPTGPLHIGTARTSLYNYLFARHMGGAYVLRIEDTDVARNTVEHERDIIDNLHWLGISWDEGPQVAGGTDIGPYAPYRQSGRLSTYAREAERLIASDAAYLCWCTLDELDAVRREQEARKEAPRYNRRCLNLTDAERAAFEAEGRKPAVRFKVEPEVIRFDDLIRGEDHLSNTPKHIALMRALGYREPVFGHIPLILNADRSKMSKRKSQTAIADYRAQGYLPEAMVNFLAFLGWSPGTEEEIFGLDELVGRFEIERVHKGGAIFDRERLDHLNGVYIRSLADEQLALRLRPFLPDAVADDDLLRIVPLVRERLVRLADVRDLTDFLWRPDDEVAGQYAIDDLVPKRLEAAGARQILERAVVVLRELDDADFSAEILEERARTAADEAGLKAGDFFKPLRVAITGRTVSPPLFASIELLGRDRTLTRLEAAIARLEAVPVA